MATGRDPDRPALALFAAELRAARQQAGLTRDELAAKVNYSSSLIGMIETGRRVPSRDLAERLDEVFGPDRGTFARLETGLRDLPYPASFRPFTAYEAEARALRMFEHVLVPGLLQTAEYARAVLSTRPYTTADEVENLVTARLARQMVLTRADPPLLYVLLDEGVLHRPVGTPEVMRAQLARVAELSEQANVVLQVIPYSAGAHIGLQGGFAIADLPDSAGIVFLDTVADGHTVEDAAIVSQVTQWFDALRAEALPRRASRDMIRRVAEERWT
jgi:transcriptional regulator with XRE-family HTH domain